MKNSVPFTVYNASAGSGKTYTLVREYLKVLLLQKDSYYFRHVLAITFTNKASMEMKQRILENLQHFALGEIGAMQQELRQQVSLNQDDFQNRSRAVLEAILQDYSAFNVTTIDSFTHRIVRTFAFDFGLTADFEVELDSDRLLQEAVDAVIAQIGFDENLTRALVQFSLQKSDEDKAWDISKELFDFAKILFNETHKTEFLTLTDESYEDYQQFKNQLIPSIKGMEKRLKRIGEEALEIMDRAGLQIEDFYFKGKFPKHFLQLTQDWEQAKFFDETTLRRDVEQGLFYAQKTAQDIKLQIDQITPDLVTLYLESEQVFSQLKLYTFWYEAIFPMTILQYIHRAVQDLKKEQNIQLIADFNELIQEKVKDEPAPFIYERLGETYRNYFIDEMQDTSVLQWHNLISLISNALSQEGGTLLLVGDAKQSIYRWRGSNPEQFLLLSDAENLQPFQVSKEVLTLETNYRSFSEIIDFNNQFFSHIADLLQEDSYRKLYLDQTVQQQNHQKGGYVQLDFLKNDREDEENPLRFPKKVLEIIQNLDCGFTWKDVCILVRTNKDGTQVAHYLTQNGIEILTSENLLLAQDANVHFILRLLQHLHNPTDEISRFDVLHFLHEHLEVSLSKHDFLQALIKLSTAEFYANLKEYGVDFSETVFAQKPLYDAVEYINRAFKVYTQSNAYLQFLLEWVLDFQTAHGSDLTGFLEDWEQNKDTLSVSVPEGKNAVRIMSIHKAKGLQFPVVIYPYDLDIYSARNEKVWYQMDPSSEFKGVDKLLLSFNEKLKYTDETGIALYEDFKKKQELDNFNLVYVALTRAVEQLYIITAYGFDSRKELNLKKFSGLFTRFLTHQNLWNEDQLTYRFGNPQKAKEQEKTAPNRMQPETVVYDTLVSTDFSDHRLVFHTRNSELWNTEQGKAIDYGNLVHAILAQIITQDDLEYAVQYYVNQGIVTDKEKNEIRGKVARVLEHPVLKPFFEPAFRVLCEREICTPDGAVFIPDRVVFFNEKEVGILDYKTGNPLAEHQLQIEQYAHLLTDMNYQVTHRFLVYINQEELLIV